MFLNSVYKIKTEYTGGVLVWWNLVYLKCIGAKNFIE